MSFSLADVPPEATRRAAYAEAAKDRPDAETLAALTTARMEEHYGRAILAWTKQDAESGGAERRSLSFRESLISPTTAGIWEADLKAKDYVVVRDGRTFTVSLAENDG